LKLIAKHFGKSAFEEVREKYRAKDVATDDILDAFAALWTAKRIWTSNARSLLENPPTDSKGLKMEIVY